MRGPVAFSCLPVLILVLQASLSVARPQGERFLLAATIRAAGAGCADGESCSTGASTTADCTAGGGTCPVIPAGTSCRTSDACSNGLPTASDGTDRQPCPADTDTNTGTCPLIPAGETPTPCNAKDKCATSATTSGACVLSSTANTAGTCSSLPIGASCSSLAGDCTPAEECNATPPVSFPSMNPNSLVLYNQDDTTGTCTAPKPAGARCAAGADLCRGYYSALPSLCIGTTCPMIRPGQYCTKTAVADKCYDGSAAGVPCAGTGPVASAGVCTALAKPTAPGKGPACIVGDACSDPTTQCNAIGNGQGECVTTVTTGAGVACAIGDNCPVVNVTLPSAAGNVFAQICPTTATATGLKCPLVPAGQKCPGGPSGNDLCSDGANGLPCNAIANAPASGGVATCNAITTGAKCYANDACAVQGQFCNGKGSTAGICVVAKAAGQACIANDLCSTGSLANLGVPTLCPTSLFCPVVPAGAGCQIKVAASGPVAARVADKCNNGNNNATISTTDCPSASTGCPVLATGLKCTELTDVCVVGAKCQKGTCQPNGKIFAATVTATPAATSKAAVSSTGFSTAATVPSVSATATVTNYIVGNFTSDVKTKYCNDIQQGILAAYSVVSNCSVGTVSAGSVVVPTTVAFSGANSDAATKAQGQFVADLKSGSGSQVFGSDFGTVTVAASSVTAGTTANPTTTSTTSGAAATGMAWTVGAVLLISAFVMAV